MRVIGEKYMIEDLYKEHESQHTSEDWANLKDSCGECYKLSKKYGNGVIAGISFKRSLDFLEDMRISPNPLER